jgi:hypothetical protein
MHQSIEFILFWNDTPHVSDGLSVHHQECKTVNLSNRYCCLLASKQTAVPVWQMPVAVCTLLNSWWRTVRPSETCRVSFQNKINLRHWCILLYLLWKQKTIKCRFVLPAVCLMLTRRVYCKWCTIRSSHGVLGFFYCGPVGCDTVWSYLLIPAFQKSISTNTTTFEL